MKKLWWLSSVLLVILLVAGCATPSTTPSPSKPVELTMVTFLPPDSTKTAEYIKLFVDEVNRQAKGVTIKVLGGSEVIGGQDMATAVQKGVVDIGMLPTAYYEGLVPVGNILMLSQYTQAEERAKGAWNYINELHNKAGLYCLPGRMEPSTDPRFWAVSTKKIEKLTDFKGLRAGAISVFYEAFAKALGMSFTLLNFGDVFSSMERGVIDVLGESTDVSAFDMGLSDLAKYVVAKPLYYKANDTTIINLNKWNGLTKEQQDTIYNTFVNNFEPKMTTFISTLNDKSAQKFKDSKAVMVEMTGDEAQKYSDLAYTSERDRLLQQFPETAPKIFKMIMKQ